MSDRPTVQRTITATSGATAYLSTLFDEIRRLEGMRDAAFTMLVRQAGYDSQAVRLVGIAGDRITIDVPAPNEAV